MADNNLAGVGALRQRFHVELKPDETTFVSWKKLVKDFPKAVQSLPFEPPAGAHPALQARIAPEATTGNSLLQKDPVSPPTNRFSAVIEKIERLYKGDESSEEEQHDKNPDDDQYDTEDSFIDDTELDEYFSVDKAKTKHTGFFVNRGKLEPVNEPASPVIAPKKRKRKDIKKAPNAEEIPKKLLKMGAVRIKAAARTAPLVGMNLKGSGQDITCLAINEYSDDKASKKQESKSTSISCESGLLKVGFQEAANKVEPLVKRVKASDKNGGFLNVLLPGYKDSSVKGEIVAEPSDADIVNHSSKHTIPRDDCQTRESLKGVSDASNADKTIIAIERAGEDSSSRDVNAVGNKLSMIKVKSLSGPKEAILARPKCTILEKAFQDLEKGVVELCPPTADVGESEQFQGVKKRLPREVKQKLGKVARLAAKQGKISDEVIGRLMGVLGHVMRLKTLKRNLKEMVESGISAKQEKEGRIQDIKREVTKMVQMQVSSLQAQDGGWQEGSTNDFQGALCSVEKGKPNGCYKWDNATEDAICNLYDQYVEGMDEHKGPQIKKLYIELAELWPQGWMDNNGIKHAVYRAKERKKKLNKLSNGGVETTKRKKTPVKSNTDGSNGDGPSGSVSNPNYEDLVLGDKHEQAHSEAVNGSDFQQFRLTEPKSSFVVHGKQKSSEKGESKDYYSNDVWNKCEGLAINKKERKPKPDIDLNETYTVPPKASFLHGKEMHKLDKQGLNGMSVPRKGSMQVIGIPVPEEVKID